VAAHRSKRDQAPGRGLPDHEERPLEGGKAMNWYLEEKAARAIIKERIARAEQQRRTRRR
jgi:hypothetical protein